MLGQVLELLGQDEYHAVSERIEIAKGKNRKPTTVRGAFNQAKRDLKWRLKRQ